MSLQEQAQLAEAMYAHITDSYWAQSTARDRALRWQNFQRFCNAQGVQTATATTDDVLAYLAFKQMTGVRMSTLADYLSTLRVAAVRLNISTVDNDVLADLQHALGTNKGAADAVKAISQQHLRQLIAAVPPSTATALWIAHKPGSRIDDVCRIERQRVHLLGVQPLPPMQWETLPLQRPTSASMLAIAWESTTKNTRHTPYRMDNVSLAADESPETWRWLEHEAPIAGRIFTDLSTASVERLLHTTFPDQRYGAQSFKKACMSRLTELAALGRIQVEHIPLVLRHKTTNLSSRTRQFGTPTSQRAHSWHERSDSVQL
jgi:hypothetical protein